MFLFKTLLHKSRNTSLLKGVLTRHYAVLYENEFKVVPFCNISINLPFNVTMVPLDLYKHNDCDKVIVKVSSITENSIPNLECTHDDGNVKISTNSQDFPLDAICKIEAPIKANINVETVQGNISLLNFNGDSIALKTKHGNVAASRCHCNEISIVSTTGDITCLNVMQAAEIILKTAKNGSITTGRLQGLNLKLETENGDVKTESSYCTNSTFITNTGQLDLHNTHKNCKVVVKKKGGLNMTGFDGILQVSLHEGDAEIQLSRIQGESKIKIEENGFLKVKVSETCLENINFEIISKNTSIDADFKQKMNFANGSDGTRSVLIDCPNSNVIVESLSLMEMFNLKC